MEGIFRRIFERAQPLLDTRDNEIHTLTAYSFALKLIEAERGDPRVVIPAILLHDTGWKSIPEDRQLAAFGPGTNDMTLNRVHEVEGAANARRILDEVGYEQPLVEEIVEIILGHDSRLEALSLNDAIVKDSDKLWRFSEKALEVDPVRFGIDPAVHTEWLKHQIDPWFFTETARNLAREEQRQRAQRYGPAAYIPNPKRGR
ncbi:MAG: HD domain-containing protein [Thermodesulfobacteriota bacterium]